MIERTKAAGQLSLELKSNVDMTTSTEYSMWQLLNINAQSNDQDRGFLEKRKTVIQTVAKRTKVVNKT